MATLICVALLMILTECAVFQSKIYCDVVIGGGNSGALSAAITAAQSAQAKNENISICLLEPTDWFGGQMTAEGVSEMDYGPQNAKSQNQAKSFESMINTIGDTGNCVASTTCYQANNLMNEWILPILSNLSQYITVYDRTVIINTLNATDYNGNKYITSITAIQRTPINPSKEWLFLLSQQIADWYSPNNSSLFTKKEYIFSAKIFIEATEFADIMMTSGITIFQGVETPNENSTTTNDHCGQATVFPFFLKLFSNIPDNTSTIPSGNNGGIPYPTAFNWLGEWIERRAYDAIPKSPRDQINFNDISQLTWQEGNDYRSGYIFLSVDDAKKGEWNGGINITTLSKAEQRSFGWYHYYINASNQTKLNIQFDTKQLVMDLNCSGTLTGLSKMPYFRDSRRSYGLFGFRLNHTTAMDIWNETSDKGNYSVGYKFDDTVAIGDYNFFDMHLLENECLNEYPNYISKAGKNGDKLVPYYIPFRSIANDEFVNLLFAGKNIAQTFFANSATRLHPVEWNIGVAAGVTSQYMVMHQINDTKIVYGKIDKLQQYLQSDVIQQPLDWT